VRDLDAKIAAAVVDAKAFLRENHWSWGLDDTQKHRGRQLHGNRDDDICMLIGLLAEEYGLSPYRSKNRHGTDKDVSASWILAKALNDLKMESITEKGVEKIWQKRKARKKATPARRAFDKAFKVATKEIEAALNARGLSLGFVSDT
jgi:hypothetical protein